MADGWRPSRDLGLTGDHLGLRVAAPVVADGALDVRRVLVAGRLVVTVPAWVGMTRSDGLARPSGGWTVEDAERFADAGTTFEQIDEDVSR